MANGDGTQAPEPAQSFTDPLAGLVSSGRPDFSVRRERDDYSDVEIASPVEPDPEMVRSMVDAALAGEQGEPGAKSGAEADDDPNATTGEVPVVKAPLPAASSQPPGVYHRQQRAWPARSQLLPQVLRRRQSRVPRDETPAPEAVRQPRRPSRGSAGLAVALVLLLVFGIVAIQFVTSFIESIAGLFD